MALTPGSRLGPYEILSPLGAGGMGEVYRAKDTRLGREVAVKVLPANFSADADRLRRFEQEAQAASALNHPNILAIHDTGMHDGAPYIVSELLQGETLRARLAGGAFSPRKAIGHALQISQGLAAAHEKGIVHRDLKPENIFVTSDGRVKILDFGLAKLTQQESSGGSQTNLSTMTPGTEPGVVLGTLGYMSPEQVRGKPTEARSDIFSFGAILYEMLSGKRAFHGDTAADTISAILTRDPPDLSETNRGIPESLDRIVRHCLEKNPEARFHSASDIAFDLEAISGTSLVSAPATAFGSVPWRERVRRAPVGVALAAALLLGMLGAWLVLRPGRRALQGGPTLLQVSRLTLEPGFSEWPSWSPDGSLLAFASNRSGNWEIYVRRVEGGQEVNITNDPAEDYEPAFSPDGNSIAFVSTRSSRTGLIKIGPYIGFEYRTYGGDIWVIPALGGQARRLVADGNFPVWHADGRRVAYISGSENHRSILEVPVEGGTPRPVLSSSASTWEIVRIQYSPSGNWISFETWDSRVLLVPAAGGTPRELLQGSSHSWDPSGKRLYYLTRDRPGGTRLQSVEIDEGSGKVSGSAHAVGLVTGILRDLAIARDGHQVVVAERRESMNLTRLLLAPAGGAPVGSEEELSSGEVRDRFPSFSPDGHRIAVASTRLGDQEVWILDLNTKQRQRLRLPRTDLGANLPYWSPDGHQLAVSRFYPDQTVSIWLAAVDGSFAEELVPPRPKLRGGPFSPDGRSLIYAYQKGVHSQLFVLDLASRQERQLTVSASDKQFPAWSPDGSWIIYSCNADGPLRIWRIPVPGGEEKVLTSGNERMGHPFYSPDGRWIYVQPSHLNIYRMPAAGGPLQKVTNFPESGLFLEEPTPSPDGRWLAYCRSNGGSSLWLLKIGNNQPQGP